MGAPIITIRIKQGPNGIEPVVVSIQKCLKNLQNGLLNIFTQKEISFLPLDCHLDPPANRKSADVQ